MQYRTTIDDFFDKKENRPIRRYTIDLADEVDGHFAAFYFDVCPECCIFHVKTYKQNRSSFKKLRDAMWEASEIILKEMYKFDEIIVPTPPGKLKKFGDFLTYNKMRYFKTTDEFDLYRVPL